MSTLEAEAPASCHVEDNVEYHTALHLEAKKHVRSLEMCCAECEADPTCGAWTWGKIRDVVGLSDVCFLKGLPRGKQVMRIQRVEVVSGLPAKTVRKHGLLAGLLANATRRDGATHPDRGVLPNETCSEALSLMGHGDLRLEVIPGEQRGRAEVLEGLWVVPHLKSKAYFVETCGRGAAEFARLKLLGKTLRYTADISGAGCGCNVNVYLVASGHEGQHGEALTYKIEIQAGNQYAWASRLHFAGKTEVLRGGYGGGGEKWNGNRDWSSSDYGHRARCVDTSRPFEVEVSFRSTPIIAKLSSLDVVLSQFGSICNVSLSLDTSRMAHPDLLDHMSDELADGLTPVVEYTSTRDLLWMDGIGIDGRGPCIVDAPEACPDSIRLYGFSITDIGEPNPIRVNRSDDSKRLFAAPMSGLALDLAMNATDHMLSHAEDRGPRSTEEVGRDARGQLVIVTEPPAHAERAFDEPAPPR